jgi:DNA-binding CsgD family transcriptional regulator
LPNGETIWDGIGLDDTQRQLSEEAQRRSYHELKLREAIANLFLTSPKERLFSDILARLRAEFNCQDGYIGYIDEKGDLCCPSLIRDSGEQCRRRDKSAVFPESAWAGLWGDSLKERRSLLKNTGLTPPPGHISLTSALVVPMLVNDQLVGQIGLANKSTGFLAADQKQLEALAEFLAPIMYLYLIKERHYEALQRSAIKLAEKNTALNVLLDNRTEEQKKMADNILLNFERLVLPYFERLKATSSRETIATILDIVSANTRESLAPLEKSASAPYRSFSPMEVQVADLVKAGKTSKQIAAILNISTRSVYFHRNNLRKKLRIHNTKANLGTVLRNLPTAS